jgi:hypothetical protein
VAAIALSLFLAISTHAQSYTNFINGDFELGAGLYTNTDNNSIITTAAVGWVQINDALRVPTAALPCTDTVYSGTYSLQCYGPSEDNGNGGLGGSFASQSISNGVLPGQTWILNGYGLTPSCDPMSDSLIGAASFACLQIAFYDSTGTNQVGSTTNSTALYAQNDPNGSNAAPNDVWISCTVTSTAPVGAAVVTFVAIHVGDSTSSGSIYWDGLTVTNTVAVPPPPVITNEFQLVIKSGSEICWPTTTNVSYQPQFSDDNVNWTSLESLTPGDGTTNCVFGFTHKFYRVTTSSQ